jgi:hypothetical protein
MTTDQAYGKASRYLDIASSIWESGDTERYCLAENYYDQAIKLKSEYFSETKILTMALDIDSLLP